MANFGEILSNIAIGAGQSVRRNALDNAFEAYTPSGGATTLSIGTVTDSTVAITSDGSADDVTLTSASNTEAGLLSANDKLRIDNIRRLIRR